MYSFANMSPRQVALSLLGLSAVASARPSNLQPRFSGVIPEARSPVVHDGAAASVGALASRLIPVVVGGPQDTFVPNMVRASVGDIVQFQFSSGNHTVTQSAEGSPCVALQATDPNAIHSGHIPYKAGQADVGTFNMPVTSTEPMFLFCATGPHCQSGQVMMINPVNDAQLLDYAKLAASAGKTVDGTTVVGGQVASIPIGAASFVAPAEEAGGPPGGGGAGAGGAPPAAEPPAAADPPAAEPPAAAEPAPPAATAAPTETTAAAAPPLPDATLPPVEAPAAPETTAPAPAPPAAAATPPVEAVAGAPAPVASGPKTTLTLFGRAESTHVVYYA